MPGRQDSSQMNLELEEVKKHKASRTATPLVRALGWASVATGAVAVGFIVGRNLRARYLLNRRTPYDYYSHAGDNGSNNVEYGVGI
ncbi:MAG: hypothetical protein ACYDC6_01025 [Acidobacteriaceae bacterium]